MAASSRKPWSTPRCFLSAEHDGSGPPFDAELAASYIGKYILLGLTYQDHEGKELRREQIHGEITSASRSGIEIALRGVHEGHTWIMPPDFEGIFPADPGNYRLHSTNEVIRDPDLISTWTITEPPPKH